MTVNLGAMLADLAARGVTLSANGDKLRVEAPSGVLTPDLRAALAAHKEAILAHLRPPAPEPEIVRIPLDGLSEYLAEHNLRVVGGTPNYGGAFRPMLYLAEGAAQEAAA